MRKPAIFVLGCLIFLACSRQSSSKTNGCYEGTEQEVFPVGTKAGIALPLNQNGYPVRPKHHLSAVVIGFQTWWEFHSDTNYWVGTEPPDSVLHSGYRVWDPCSGPWPKGEKTAVAYTDELLLVDSNATADSLGLSGAIFRSSDKGVYWFALDSIQDDRVYTEFAKLYRLTDENVVKGGGVSFPKGQ